MAELGYDLLNNTRKQLNLEMVEEADKIVVITEKKNLPDSARNSLKLIFWSIEDAKARSYEFHCKIRD
jgi:protein-tyrosine-phosphatase